MSRRERRRGPLRSLLKFTIAGIYILGQTFKKPKRWMGGVAFVLVAAGLAACVFHTERMVVKEPLKEGRIRVVYWEKWQNEEGEAMRKVVNAFNQKQDKYFVDYLPVSQIATKTLLATAGDIPPDVAGLFGEDLAQYASVNAIQPLDDLIARDRIDPADYIDVYWQMANYEGRQFAMPSAPASTALFYNASQWLKAGLDPEDPPETLEEFNAAIEKLTIKENGKLIQAGFLPAEPGWWRDRFGYIFGGEMWDGKGQITANSPENIRAYKWIQSLSKRYGFQASSDFKGGFGGFNSPQNAFMTGEVSSVIQGCWMPRFIAKNNPDLDWRVAPFPYPSDRPDLKDMTYVDMDILVIPRGARQKVGAWEFIKYVQSQEGMELLCIGQGKQTPLKEVSDSFWVKNPNPKVRLFHELAQSPAAKAPPRIGIWKAYKSQMQAAFDRITQGEDVEKVLGEVQARMQPMLDQEMRVREKRKGQGS